MNKTLMSIIIGIFVGALDLIPLIMVKAPLLNMTAIVVFWVVTSFFISRVTLVENSLLNGLIIATLNMLPLILTIYTINPKDFLPMLSMAIILGPLTGFLNNRYAK